LAEFTRACFGIGDFDLPAAPACAAGCRIGGWRKGLNEVGELLTALPTRAAVFEGDAKAWPTNGVLAPLGPSHGHTAA
jgi:hypothetical protein